MYRLFRPSKSVHQTFRFLVRRSIRSHLHASASRAQLQEHSDPHAHRNFYKSHGRALFKALTLAFFSFQVFYYGWLTLETEYLKDEKKYQIQALEGEVRLLEEGRRSHRPVEQVPVVDNVNGTRILEEGRKA